jgi:Caspase domain
MRQQLTLAFGLLLLCVSIHTAFAQQNSVALLIGNAAYPDADAPLRGPVTDARALADQLKRLGFDVVVGENLKKEAMRRALDQFYVKIKSNSTALIYFGGFGIQSDHQSYVIPIDAQIWNESDVRRDGLSLDKILAEMTSKGARAKIAIVDASRRNPFERRFRSISAGLAAIAVPRGAVVMTSAPSDTVIGDDGSHVFTVNLIKELAVPDAKIAEIFKQTQTDVARATKQQQVPWFSSSLEEDFALGSRSQAAAPAAGPAALQPNGDDGRQAAESAKLPKEPSLPPADSPAVANAQPKAAEPAQPKSAEPESALPLTSSLPPAGGDTPTAPLARPLDQFAKANVDPALIGTFKRNSMIDDYDSHFEYSIAADGTCRWVTTEEEDGIYSGGRGHYRTVADKTGRVRTGTYRAAGRAAIEVTSSTGITAIFKPLQPSGPVNRANPAMLGIWRATVAQDGLTWVVTVQNNPDGTYHYRASTEDSGNCTFADPQWSRTSATGKFETGTYRFLDDRHVEMTGANGPTVWQRQ